MDRRVQDHDPGHLTGAIGAAFILLLNILSLEKDSIGRRTDYPTDFGKNLSEDSNLKFDFIIVGAGAAGCVLANKLTERSDWRVLLVEAGSDPSPSTDVPAFYPTLLNTSEDWQFTTDDDEGACQGMMDKKCVIHKGKVLGGTSTINNLHYLRTSPKEFEKWVSMGYEDWGSESTEFFYEKLENYRGDDFYTMPFGMAGNLAVDSFNSDHYVKKLIYDAANKMGFEKFTEYSYLGYLDTPGTLKDGTRYNMAKAFLNPIKGRSNFFLLKRGYITKLIIPDVREKRVKGVECLVRGKLKRLWAKREVILCAGAINNAKILPVSGIGPASTLKSLKIPIIADLPVGENLRDHLGVPIFVALDKDKSANNPDQPIDLVDSTYLYIIHKTGPLANTNINNVVGYVNLNSEPYESPDVAIYHYYFEPDDIFFRGLLDNIRYEPVIKETLLKTNKDQSIVMFLPVLLRPKSKGKIIVIGKDIFAQPVIQPNFLSHQEDLQTLTEGFKYVTKFIKTPAFQEYHAEIIHIDIPHCRNLKFLTEFYIKCYIKHMAFPQGNVAGTAKMGTGCDEDSVVDESLTVKGVRGLRIVDASVMPELVSGSIPATVAMIASRVSECIKHRWLPNYEPQPHCICKTSYNN